MTVLIVAPARVTPADRSGESLTIDGAYVRERVADLAKNTDLSRYIL